MLIAYIGGVFFTLTWTLSQDYDVTAQSLQSRMLGNVLVSTFWPLFWFTALTMWINDW